MLTGQSTATDALTELLYRERFGLSWHQMQAEPAEVVETWLILEGERRKAEDKERKRTHTRR